MKEGVFHLAEKTPGWLGHWQTIKPALFRKTQLRKPESLRWDTPDGDFLDVDLYRSDMENQSWVILNHGLEGDSNRPYMLGMIRALLSENYNVLAWNYRSCSGELNRKPGFYHSGSYEDLAFICKQCHQLLKAEDIKLVGFSLGGNITLQFIASQARHGLPLSKVVVFSVPLHLSSSCSQIDKGFSRLYAKRFVRSLKKKVRAKAQLFPGEIPLENLPKIKGLRDFDEYITAPLNGFNDAEDYYEQCSSLYVLDRIKVPFLVVNAQNDPMLSDYCYPYATFKDHPYGQFEAPDFGGHCGFEASHPLGMYWSEWRVIQYFRT